LCIFQLAILWIFALQLSTFLFYNKQHLGKYLQRSVNVKRCKENLRKEPPSIHFLEIESKLLIESELSHKEQMTDDLGQYTKAELTEALRPVVSVISKCEKAQMKFAEGSSHYRRLENLVKAMEIARALIEAPLALDRINANG
jgi:hypothetical protein